MATHSSILAWRIRWAEEPTGLQSMGSQRIRHNWAHKYTHPIGKWKKITFIIYTHSHGFPRSSVSNESACSAGDPDSIPGSGISPGEGNGYPLQYSCLENPHGQRSLVGYSPWGCKSRTRLSDYTTTIILLPRNHFAFGKDPKELFAKIKFNIVLEY